MVKNTPSYLGKTGVKPMINAIKTWWDRLSSWPCGKWLFSRIVGYLIPYTGTVSPNIVRLAPGYAEVFIKDKRRHRNHLRSIHALALGNLGEVTTGLALHFALESNKRAILVNLTIDYLKKARGVITAKATIAAPKNLLGLVVVQASLLDHQSEIVAKCVATWLVREK
jgi:acyl-coenzyme A thioesterase PaaI-like protein